jgi:hypothetical protein
MSESETNKKTSNEAVETTQKKITPLRSLIGAIIASGLAIALYSLMSSIAQTYAAKPIVATSPIVLKITIAVRTLVTGVVALGAGVFAFVAVGLLLLTIQLAIENMKNNEQSTNK